MDLKLNLDDFENLSLNSKSVIESLKYENFNLKEFGNININSSYKKKLFEYGFKLKVYKYEFKYKKS